jgi:hypothetical protein
VSILENTNLGRSVGTALSGFSTLGGPTLAERLLQEVRRLSEMIKERELSTARRVVLWVLTMFDSHYQGLDRMALSGGWSPGVSDATAINLRKICASFARAMAYAAMKDLDLLPRDELEDPESSRLHLRCIISGCKDLRTIRV